MIADLNLLTSSFINIKGFNCFMSWHLKKLQQKRTSYSRQIRETNINCYLSICMNDIIDLPYQQDL